MLKSVKIWFSKWIVIVKSPPNFSDDFFVQLNSSGACLKRIFVGNFNFRNTHSLSNFWQTVNSWIHKVLWIFTFHLNKLSGVLKSKIFCQKSTYLKKTTEVCQKVSKSYFQSGLLFLRIPHDFVFNQIVQEHVWKEHLLVTPFFETLTACLIFWQTVSSWIHKVQWFPLIECVDFGQNLAFEDPETLLGEK